MTKSTLSRFAAVVAMAILILTACEDTVTPKLVDRVAHLASDDLEGRDNDTTGGLAARQYLIDQLGDLAPGAVSGATGDAAYLQPFTVSRPAGAAVGANVLAVVEGTTRPDEFVIVSAHYDHLGSNCHEGIDPSDTVCNGATDNATGVALVLGLAEKFAQSPPDRSVLFAFFDAEEDGLAGSQYYVSNPVVPLAQTVAIVNIDIVGSRLLPSLADVTYALGAETGGPAMRAAVGEAYAHSALEGTQLSALFGQNRSDHFWFLNNEIPALFFTDISGRCYHTTSDEIDVVDFAKLKKQLDVAYLTVGQLVHEIDGTIVSPTWTEAPVVSYDDAVGILDSIERAAEDLELLAPADRAKVLDHETTLTGIVAAGPGAFDSDALLATAVAANDMVGILTNGPCDGFLD